MMMKLHSWMMASISGESMIQDGSTDSLVILTGQRPGWKTKQVWETEATYSRSKENMRTPVTPKRMCIYCS